MKTPMQELIEWLLDRKNKTPQNLHFEKGLHSALDSCITEAKSMLEKEKEVIENAVSRGWDYNEDGYVRWMGEKYYNETFNTEAK